MVTSAARRARTAYGEARHGYGLNGLMAAGLVGTVLLLRYGLPAVALVLPLTIVAAVAPAPWAVAAGLPAAALLGATVLLLVGTLVLAVVGDLVSLVRPPTGPVRWWRGRGYWTLAWRLARRRVVSSPRSRR